MVRNNFSRCVALLLFLIASMGLAPLAYAGSFSSQIAPLHGETQDLTYEDFLADNDNYFDMWFTDADDQKLPVVYQKIDVSIPGNELFGDIAYVMNVTAPRDSVVYFNVDNFIKGTNYDADSWTSEFINSTIVDTIGTFSTFYDDDGWLWYEEKNVMTRYMGDHATEYSSLPVTARHEKSFFDDWYSYKLSTTGRSDFDHGYYFIAQNGKFQHNECWQAYVFFTYAEDKDAADKITALPDAADVTLESAEQIAAARAAYDLLAQWEGAQDAIDVTKLEAAEAKLAELQKAAATTELEQAIAEAEKVDTSKLTNDQKKTLQDAIDTAKDALKDGGLTTDAIIAAKNAIAGATTTAQAQVAEAIKAAEEASKAKTELKANPMTVKAKTVKAKSKKKTTIKKSKAFKVKNAQGAVTFMKKSGNKKIKVSKAGKVTVKKGLKKGKTYKVKVQVSAAGNAQYKPATAIVTLKVKVK